MKIDRWSRTVSRLAPVVAASAGLAASSAPAMAQESASNRGLEIAQEWEKRDTGFGDQTAILTMVLRNAHGQESSREIRSRTLEVEGDGDKSLVIFDRPRDLEGTAFLTFSHATGSDDQWLYLPAAKRVKRISTSDLSPSPSLLWSWRAAFSFSLCLPST